MKSSELITIATGQFEATINTLGAELKEFSAGKDKSNWLWNGEQWAHTAPILFPIVGNLNNGKFVHDNSEYSLPRHGFARQSLFKVVAKGDDFLKLQLTSNASTFENYPFTFTLTVDFFVNPKGLTVEYNVENTSESSMWFSIGSHPGFNSSSDTVIEFEDVAQPFIGKEGFTELKEHAPLSVRNNSVKLEEWDFNKGPLYFKNLKRQCIKIHDNKYGTRCINIPCTPYFTLWKVPDADFVCLEPWHGITADPTDTVNQLSDKRGIIHLESGNKFGTYYQLSLV
ncbi:MULTISPECIES: hypothetical protein [unclassified Vibrio]|uniref:aldose epimerase family protein n=1 Tax=unclassified Vibrio TaxID=2614977 RepID=UPI00354E3C56